MSHLRLALEQRPLASLALGLALCAIGIGLPVLLKHSQEEASAALSSTQRQRARLADDVSSARQGLHDLQPTLAEWRSLTTRGLMNPTTPAAWAAEFASIQAQHGVMAEPPRVKAAPRTIGDASTPASARLLSHDIEIDAVLRHEARLLPLMSALSSIPGALLLPRSCTLTLRASDQIDRIHAQCRFERLTVSVPSLQP